MTVHSPPVILTGVATPAEDIRRAVASTLPPGQGGWHGRGGVVGFSDFEVTQQGTPAMAVNVLAGEAWVPGDVGATQGAYYMLNDATAAQAISGADLSNPRIDTVIALIEDTSYLGTNQDCKIAVLEGTPTSGASLSNLSGAATVPASALVLAYVLVPAAATGITSGDLSDARWRTANMDKVRCYRTAAMNFGTSLATVVFDSIDPGQNPNGCYSAATGGFTCRTDGWHRVDAALRGVSGAASQWISIAAAVNGTVELGDNIRWAYEASQQFGPTLSGLVRCYAGDVITLQAFASTALPMWVGEGPQNYLTVAFDGLG